MPSERPVPATRPTAGVGVWPFSTRPSVLPTLAVGGNRCGHQPTAPRFHHIHLPADANPARPALIIKAIHQLWHYYQTPRDACWDPLSQGERHQHLNRQLAAAGGPATDTGQVLRAKLARWRQQRSERRESLIAVLSLMFYYTDIVTLKVAIPHGNDWLGLSAPWIAQQTTLSLSRVKRALATLARCTLLINTGRGRQFDRRRRCWVGTGWGPVRRLSFRLIRALGLEVSWQQAQRKARKPVHHRPAAAPPPHPAPAASETPRAHTRALRQSLSPTAPAADAAAIERNRRLAELAAAGLSLSEIRERLNRTPQAP
ncbi:MAG: hypothetical protein IPK63_10355 [Candidatus Competibacteraceae bacterium]|nr:hypothetical protein [Candidatus Competibacteraceae bacterium]